MTPFSQHPHTVIDTPTLVPGLLWGPQAREDAVKLEAFAAQAARHRACPPPGAGGRTGRQQDDAADSHAAVYLLRTTHQNHVHLSLMADQKASILIGAAFVLLTILFAHLREHPLTVPLTILTVTTMTAAFFAILTVMPCVAPRKLPRTPINPLFFGAFTVLDWDAYERLMLDILADEAKCYKAMVRDIYLLGGILQRKKYRYLAYSYKVFGIGFLMTFLAMAGDYFHVWSRLPWMG
jgi:hypothetical protein